MDNVFQIVSSKNPVLFNDFGELHYSSPESSFSDASIEARSSDSTVSTLSSKSSEPPQESQLDNSPPENSDDCAFMKSQKGRDIALHKNYTYYFQKNLCGDRRKTWLCTNYQVKELSCKARVWTENGKVVKFINDHTHLASLEDVVKKGFLNKIKNEAVISGAPPQKILVDNIGGLQSEILYGLPAKDSLKRTMKRARRANKPDSSLPAPKTTNEIEIPEALKSITINGKAERFLMFDTGTRCLPQRLFLFATKASLKLLATSDNWQADGTFRIAPQLFSQVYSIHVEYKGKTLPCVYAAVTNKTENTYTLIFNCIKVLIETKLGIKPNPKTIMTDFETAAIEAISTCFPEAIITCCYFHLKQSGRRKVNELRMKNIYDTDLNFAINLKMMIALAFIPIEKVEEGFNLIIKSDEFPESATPFATYFEKTYIGNNARFPPKLWNMVDRTRNNMSRTNNAVESWHSTLRYTIPQGNQSIYTFLESLRNQHQLQYYELCLLNSEAATRSKSIKYTDINARMIKIVNNFKEGTDVLPYLRTVASQFTL